MDKKEDPADGVFALLIKPEIDNNKVVGFQTLSTTHNMLDESIIAVLQAWLRAYNDKYYEKYKN